METNVARAICPECEAKVQADGELVVNEVLSCRECGAELEVESLEPLTLVLAPEVDEDWGE